MLLPNLLASCNWQGNGWERYLSVKWLAPDFKAFSKGRLIAFSPTRHPNSPHLAFVWVFILSTMPTSCAISISSLIAGNASTLELTGANYKAPNQGLLSRSPAPALPARPCKSCGTHWSSFENPLPQVGLANYFCPMQSLFTHSIKGL